MVVDIFWRNNHFHVRRYNLINFGRSNLFCTRKYLIRYEKYSFQNWENAKISWWGIDGNRITDESWTHEAFTDNWELELVDHWFLLHRKKAIFCFSKFLCQFSPVFSICKHAATCKRKNYLSLFPIFFVNSIISFEGAEGLHCDESQFLCKNEKVIA